VTIKSYTTSNPLVEGNFYSFKVKARNAVGFSDESAVISIKAAQKPDKPLNVATAIVSGGVAVSWTA
jgi:hypothetical protein